jgi:threonine dehydrogenase-like Zn-dependent dehydrogenase
VGEIPEPDKADGSVLVEGLYIGICGTDVEIVDEGYGAAPDGSDRLVLGHESLGRVVEAPAGSGLAAGDMVAGVVRRPDPVPCPACARGAWDYCRNGRYIERGIRDAHGYGAEQWRVEPFFAVKVPAELDRFGVLTEPTSVTAVDALAAADRSWLERLVSRTVPLSDWRSALNKTPDDIKVAVDLQD